jgi:hypothetical protein
MAYCIYKHVQATEQVYTNSYKWQSAFFPINSGTVFLLCINWASKIVSEKTTFEVRTNHFVNLFWLLCKTNFFAYFINSRNCVLSFETDSSVDLEMCTSFRGITETVPSLFRGFFLERNSFSKTRCRKQLYAHRLWYTIHAVKNLNSQKNAVEKKG